MFHGFSPGIIKFLIQPNYIFDLKLLAMIYQKLLVLVVEHFKKLILDAQSILANTEKYVEIKNVNLIILT